MISALWSRQRDHILYGLGTTSLFLVVIMWSFSSYLTSEVLDSYKQPLILTMASCLTFLLYFVFLVCPDPLVALVKSLKENEAQMSFTGNGGKNSNLSSDAESADGLLHEALDQKKKVASVDGELPPYTNTQLAFVGFVFFCLYFLSNFLLNFALADCSLAQVGNLISTSGFFTLILGAFFGVEELSGLRLGAVLLSLVATLMTVLPGFSFDSETSRAALCALGSAFIYGCYSIYLKDREARIPTMPILFAFVGVYTLVLMVPLVFFLVWVGFLSVHDLIPSRSTAVAILVNALVGGLIPNYMWNVAFALTTPLMVAIGLSFSTPLNILTGYIKDGTVRWIEVWAAMVLVCSFVILNLATLNPDLDTRIDNRFIVLFNQLTGRSNAKTKQAPAFH